MIERALRSWRRTSRSVQAARTADLAVQVQHLTELVHGMLENLGAESQISDPGRHLGRLEAIQALVARTYEARFDWAAEVRALRAEDGYASPWEETQPLISVRIATYNNAEILVDRALASVVGQTYGNWEAIVVGDACTDDTAQRVRAIGDPRIRFENLPIRGPYPLDETAFWHTAGIPPSNRALELARGAWVAALDHDDEWDEDHLEVLLAEARRTRAEIVYGGWRMVDAERNRTFDHVFGGVYPPRDGAVGFQTALCHGKLSRFRYDMNAYLAGEPGDRNLARRLWEAGVRFAALDRPVVTYWFSPGTPWGRAWLAGVRADYGYTKEP